ncbi:hypothetical protein [Rickettsiales endosymbiont of Stachyamoeba lipophora]|uniref:hypothetical protein n=1 Tax=Rickettsiales endosymbiont of Stachyamoeba lipophora TaxID=2486578 RepID=UPI000F651CFF|nr:hypothetical protein [Rickettsiales endosymbiont of Stachyamoeba lipophora]AZL15559.1 hypothetical protein EF513_03200 [Rickettsiales endosymbiont of Stachyamoeba lipophora]
MKVDFNEHYSSILDTLDTTEFQKLFQSLAADKITHLDLSNNTLSLQAFEIIAEYLPKFIQLTTLKINNTYIAPDYIKLMTNSIKQCANLKELTIGGETFSFSTHQELMAFDQLEEQLSFHNFSDAYWTDIVIKSQSTEHNTPIIPSIFFKGLNSNREKLYERKFSSQRNHDINSSTNTKSTNHF